MNESTPEPARRPIPTQSTTSTLRTPRNVVGRNVTDTKTDEESPKKSPLLSTFGIEVFVAFVDDTVINAVTGA